MAFLRGVNLGPTRKVSMERLRALASELGYTDVWTFLNSGNLVLSTTEPPAAVAEALSAALLAEYGTRIDVAVRCVEHLRAVLAANPYPDASTSQVTIAFLTGPPAADAQQRVAAVATPAEAVTFAGQEVWVHYGDGLAGSRLAADFSRLVGVSSTVRTVGTVSRILARLDR